MSTQENNKSQIKSRQRVADHGEVFTNPREVNAKLSKKAFYKEVCKTFLFGGLYMLFNNAQKHLLDSEAINSKCSWSR